MLLALTLLALSAATGSESLSEFCTLIKDDYRQSGCCPSTSPGVQTYGYRGICMSELAKWRYAEVVDGSALNQVYADMGFGAFYDFLEGYYVPGLMLNCPGSLILYPMQAGLMQVDGVDAVPCSEVHIANENFMNEVWGNETLLFMDAVADPESIAGLSPLSSVPDRFETDCDDIQDWFDRVESSAALDALWLGFTLAVGGGHWATVGFLAGLSCTVNSTVYGGTFSLSDAGTNPVKFKFMGEEGGRVMGAATAKVCTETKAHDPVALDNMYVTDRCMALWATSVPFIPFEGMHANGTLMEAWEGLFVDTSKNWPKGTAYCGGSPYLVGFVRGYEEKMADGYFGLFIDETHPAWDAVMMVYTIHEEIFRLERKVNVNMLEGKKSTYDRPPNPQGVVDQYICGYNSYPIYFINDWGEEEGAQRWMDFATNDYGCGVGYAFSKGVDMTSVAPRIPAKVIKTRSEHLATAVHDAKQLFNASDPQIECKKGVFEVLAMDLFCGHLAKVEYAVGSFGSAGVEIEVATGFNGTAYTYAKSAYACATQELPKLMPYHPFNDEELRGDFKPYGFAWGVAGGFMECFM